LLRVSLMLAAYLEVATPGMTGRERRRLFGSVVENTGDRW